MRVLVLLRFIRAETYKVVDRLPVDGETACLVGHEATTLGGTDYR